MTIRPRDQRHPPLTCPLCVELDEAGASEPELWEHLIVAHAAVDRVARTVAELADLDAEGAP